MPTAELTIAGEARSAGLARRFLSETLLGWGVGDYEDTAELLLSELVTNAVLHARSRITVRVDLSPACLRMEVADDSPRPPVTRHYSAEATTGRGLNLVAALAQRWGVLPEGQGKAVWVELTPEGARRRRVPETEAEPDLASYPDLEDLASEDGTGSAGNGDGTTPLRAA